MSEYSQHLLWNMSMIIADDGPLRARLGRVAQLNTRVISLDPESKVAGNLAPIVPRRCWSRR